MSISAAAIGAIVSTWHQPAAPKGFDAEPRSDFDARGQTVGEALAPLARSVDEAAAVLEIIKRESAMDPWVHAGLVHPDPRLHQDHFRARCLVQAHASRYAPDLDALGGSDLESTTRCLAVGVRMLRSAAFMCTHGSMFSIDDMARVFAAYKNSGVSCTPTRQSIDRAHEWAVIRARLWAADASAKRTRVARGDMEAEVAPLPNVRQEER